MTNTLASSEIRSGNRAEVGVSTGWQWPTASDRLITRVLLVLGVVLRLRQYLFNRSLWLDESLLVLNLLSRSASELLTPLSYHQGAPLGFLMLEQAVIRFFGSGEMALRLIPFLAGLASLFLFAELAKRFLVPAAVPIAVGLFAISEPLIYYSSEAKQYSTDVAVALGLFLIAESVINGRGRTLGTLILSLVAGVSIWFSQPAAFVVAAIGITWLWVAVRKRDRSTLIQFVLFGAITSGSFALSYFLSLRNLLHDPWLMGYWNGAFMPMPPFSRAAVLWFISTWLAMCENPVGVTFVGIATAAAVIGAREIFRDDRRRLLWLASPIFIALVASGLHRYPFRGRLLLFAVPSVVLMIAAGLAAIRTRTRDVVPGLGALLIGLLFFQPVVTASRYLYKPRGVEEIRPGLDYVEKHRATGDILYCYYDAEPALRYYSATQRIHSIPWVIGVESRQNWVRYRQDLDHLKGDSRVWVLFSHVYRDGGVDEERLFLDYLDGIGKREDAFQTVGASVYLYNLHARQ
jgi:hypothetical protein